MIETYEHLKTNQAEARSFERSVVMKSRLSGLMQRAGVSGSLAQRYFDTSPNEETYTVSASGMELIAEGAKDVLDELPLTQEQHDAMHTAVVYIRTTQGLPQDEIAKVLCSLINNGIDIGGDRVVDLVRTALPDFVAKTTDEDYALVLQGIVPQRRENESVELSKQLIEERIALMILNRLDITEGAAKFFECLNIEAALHQTSGFGIEEVRNDIVMQNSLSSENKYLKKLIMSDRLLGMPNRCAVDDFVSRMARSISTMDAHAPNYAEQERLAEYQTVVGFVDLNRFKGFQDANGGHDFGNVYLASIRDGLQAAAQKLFPHGMVWRQSGDEFGFIVPFAVHMNGNVAGYIAELDAAVRDCMYRAYIDNVTAGMFDGVSNKPNEELLGVKKLLFPEAKFEEKDIRDLLFSIGFSVQFMPSSEAELKSMWTQADEAMFSQKGTLFGGGNSRTIERQASSKRTVIARKLGKATVPVQE